MSNLFRFDKDLLETALSAKLYYLLEGIGHGPGVDAFPIPLYPIPLLPLSHEQFPRTRTGEPSLALFLAYMFPLRVTRIALASEGLLAHTVTDLTLQEA